MYKKILLFMLVASSSMAADWFVKQGGTGDGTDHSTPWGKPSDIDWDSIQSGDNLYFCGTLFLHATLNGNLLGQGNITIGKSGVHLRGDYPGEPGILWCAYYDDRPYGLRAESWQDLGNGVFYNVTTFANNQAYAYYGLWEDITGDYPKKYTALDSSAEVIACSETTTGVYFKQTTGDNQAEVWLRPFNSETFATNLYWTGAGYRLFVGDGKDNVSLSNFSIIGGRILATASYTGYTWTNVYITSYGADARSCYEPNESTYETFDGCMFAKAGNGLYFRWDSSPLNHITIKNSLFFDIGTHWYAGTDGHCIGIQNNNDYLIENCIMFGSGSGIDCHLGAGMTQRNITIRRVKVFGMDASKGTGAAGVGITLEGDQYTDPANVSGYLIEHCLVFDCPDNSGISTSRKCVVEVWNNTVVGCEQNYKLHSANTVNGAGIDFRNNVSINPILYHVYHNQNNNPVTFTVDAWDNNHYYPVAGSDFYYLSNGSGSACSFATFKTRFLNDGYTVDVVSKTTDPLLGGDYFPKNGSPLIDAGDNTVGLAGEKDLRGVTLPAGSSIDIGAYERTGSF